MNFWRRIEENDWNCLEKNNSVVLKIDMEIDEKFNYKKWQKWSEILDQKLIERYFGEFKSYKR